MKISIQCYTLRTEFEKDPEATLTRLRQIGFHYVELAGLYGRTPAEFKTLLDRNQLQVSGTHVGLDRLEQDFDGLVAECRTLGTRDVIVPWVPEERYEQGWARFAQSLTPHIDKLEGEGLRFSYHNHQFEFKDENGRPGLDRFYEAADPRLHAQLDLYWCHKGGQDPAAYIRKLKGRILSTHLKDGTGPDTPHVPAGQGVLDWGAILSASEEAGVEIGTIEFDEYVGDGFENVAQSLRFFSGKGYND